MTDHLKNVLIGLFVVAGMTIMVAMILFLEPTIGDGKKTFEVRFANIAGLSMGTRVTFAGKPVGEVVQIKEIKTARDEPSDETGRVYLYQLTLKVDSSVDVYTTDEIAIRTTGLMGEKSIAILPKITAKGKMGTLVSSDQVLYANSVDPLENTFNQISKVANRLDGTLHQFDTWFKDNQGHLSQAVQSFDGAMARVDTVLNTVDKEKLVPAVRESVAVLTQNLELVRTSLEEDHLLPRIASLTSHLDQAVDSFNNDGAQALRHIHQISRDLATGTGTLGRFIAADDFYLRLTSLLSKGETLMNDINHYGLLFQYDKGWQRSRTKKANLLKALDTPQEFRSYFEGEIDTITTSLGRLTELVDKAGGSKEREKVVQSEVFKKDFAELLRRAQSLSDSIKLYNQELVGKSEASN